MSDVATTSPTGAYRFGRSMLIYLALLALALAVYWPTLRFGYVDFDDDYYVWRNAAVLQGLNPVTIKWAFTSFEVANWHPVTWLSLMLDTNIFGASNAFGSHLVNVGLHALNAMLLFGLMRTMTGAVWRSALIAALLAVHPLHVESVAWVSERKDVLSMMFGLLTIRAYVTYARTGAVKHYAIVMVLLTLGLMAKPMLVTLPAVMLLLDIWPLRRVQAPVFSRGFWRRLARLALEKLPMLAPVIFVGVMTAMAQGVADDPTDGIIAPLSQRVENAVVSYVLYMGKLFWPVDLAVIYPNDALLGIDMWTTRQFIAAGGLLALITAIAIVQARARPWIVVGWLWYLGTMLPVIGLVQIGRQSMADRYAYFPFIGLYVIISWALGEMLARTPLATRIACGAMIGCAVAALGIAAHRQVWVWTDSDSLYQHALDVTDNNWVAHINIAANLTRAGDIEGTMRHLQQALDIYPDSAWLRTYFGVVLTNAGRLHEAEIELRKVADSDHPTFVAAHTNLGMTLIKMGRVDEGLASLRRAVEADPVLAESHMILALQLHKHGQGDEARREMDEAVRLKPSMAGQWRSLLE